MLKKNRDYRFLACASAVCLLVGCGSKAPDPPGDYTLGGDSVQSLNAVLGEDVQWQITAAQTPETQAAASSSAASGGDETCLYTYEKLETAGQSVQKYVEKLTEEADGFQIVDETETAAEPPDYTAESGSVALAKTASETGKVLRLDISWTATDCQIVVTRPEGEVSADTPEAEPMTNDDAVRYMQGLSPAALGLSGDSMADYSVYPMEGGVLVDGMLCLKLQIYPPRVEGQANAIAGTYLLTGDRAHIYLLENGAVREVNL